jgi:hypothetical protein
MGHDISSWQNNTAGFDDRARRTSILRAWPDKASNCSVKQALSGRRDG